MEILQIEVTDAIKELIKLYCQRIVKKDEISISKKNGGVPVQYVDVTDADLFMGNLVAFKLTSDITLVISTNVDEHTILGLEGRLPDGRFVEELSDEEQARLIEIIKGSILQVSDEEQARLIEELAGNSELKVTTNTSYDTYVRRFIIHGGIEIEELDDDDSLFGTSIAQDNGRFSKKQLIKLLKD